MKGGKSDTINIVISSNVWSKFLSNLFPPYSILGPQKDAQVATK